MLKQIFDVVVAGVALVLLLPVMIVIALLVKLDSPGPVLYRQTRLGRDLRPFVIYKFRTMVLEADRNGPSIAVGKDPRVTQTGRFLRRFDLDELPSLFNVLKGQMSIVGPRPEIPKYLPYYTEEQRLVFTVRPGLTDLGTVAFRNEASHLDGGDAEGVYLREILPRKLSLSLEYVKRRNFLYDLQLILRTAALILLQRKG